MPSPTPVLSSCSCVACTVLHSLSWAPHVPPQADPGEAELGQRSPQVLALSSHWL